MHSVLSNIHPRIFFILCLGLVKDIVPLCDPAGPTKTDATIDCLVVSDETRNGGQAVNILRKDANLPEMELFSIDLVSNEDVQRYTL